LNKKTAEKVRMRKKGDTPDIRRRKRSGRSRWNIRVKGEKGRSWKRTEKKYPKKSCGERVRNLEMKRGSSPKAEQQRKESKN